MLSLILTIAGSLLPLLQGLGVSTGTTTLISSLLGPIGTLISNLMAGTSKTQDALAALGAMQGVVTVLEADTTLSPDKLTQLANIAADIKNALVFYVKAEGGLDLTVYQQITPV